MREVAHLEKEFSHQNGWNMEKAGFFVVDLLQYLQTLDKNRFRQFALTVDLDAHRKLLTAGVALRNPIEICIDCPYTVLAWWVTEYPGIIHSAHYVFDQGEPFEEPFTRRWTFEKERLVSPGGADAFWQLIKTVTSADMKQQPGLQVADMLAWATNRVLSIGSGEGTFKHLEPIMKKIIPSAWTLWDEQKLRTEGLADSYPRSSLPEAGPSR